MVTLPLSTPRRKCGARPNPSKLMSPATTRDAAPAATSQSTHMPATMATTVRSRLPARTSSRTNAIGALFMDNPPSATVAPSGTDAAASAREICFEMGPVTPNTYQTSG